MRVCMLAYSFYETDNRIRRYAEALVVKGESVDIICLRREDGQPLYEKINGVNLYRIQKRIINERGKLSYVIRIIAFILKSFGFLTRKHLGNRYDLIHVHNVPDFLVFAAIIPKLAGTPIILDIHDILPEFYISKFNKSNTSVYYKLLLILEKSSIAFSDHVIISNHIWFRTLVSRSVKSDKCTVILNYPDPAIFYKHQRNGTEGKFKMIYPGSLNWHQGLDIAIKAVAIIKDQAPEVEFLIYGEGREKEALMRLVSRLGIDDRVIFKGALSYKEMADEMAGADLGIVPKRANTFGNEAFSTKILEFMAVGVPVIVSSTKIDRYYFSDSLVKFFESENSLSLAENIILLKSNRMIREQLVINSLRYIEENNWDLKRYTYFALVDSLCGKSETEVSSREERW